MYDGGLSLCFGGYLNVRKIILIGEEKNTWPHVLIFGESERFDGNEWDDYHHLCEEIYGKKFSFSQNKHTPEMLEMWDKLSDKARSLEENYEKEDEEMFIRLVKVRRYLWT